MTDTPTVTKPQKSPAVRTTLFLAVVGVVVGTFVLLGRQEPPPTMPATTPHKLTFTLNGDLIGVTGEPEFDAAAAVGGLAVALEKKAVEKRVNTTCQACHGAAGLDLSTHPCAIIGKCIPERHPPKTECIKCHRMPKPDERVPPVPHGKTASPAG